MAWLLSGRKLTNLQNFSFLCFSTAEKLYTKFFVKQPKLVKYVKIDRFLVCTHVPPFCPGKGEWSFVVDLTSVDPEDLSYDEHGKWGRPSGRKIYLQKDENGRLVKAGEGKMPAAPWSMLVRCNRYSHPSAAVGGHCRKVTYVARDPEGEIAVGFGIVTYSTNVKPEDLKAEPHGSAKDQETGFQRVKPSTRKLAKSCLLSETPKGAFLSVVQKKGGVVSGASPTDFPRSSRQFRELKHDASIDGKTMTAAGRPGKGNVQELLKMMQHADSFVKDCTTVAPEKQGDLPSFRVFLADKRALAIFKCNNLHGNFFAFLPVVKIGKSVNFFRFCIDFK